VDENNRKVIEIAGFIHEIFRVLDVPLEQNPDMKDTPRRVAKMYVNEFFKNQGRPLEELDAQMTLFDSVNSKGELIMIRNIPFTSVCRHHLLPFYGKVNVAYSPQKKIFGLSKIPRIVNWFSSKPQLQECLTDEIANYIYNFADAEYVRVVMKAEHTCIACRGVGVNCDTITTSVKPCYFNPKRFAEMGGYDFD